MKIDLSKEWKVSTVMLWVLLIVGGMILLYPRLKNGTYGFLLLSLLLFDVIYGFLCFLMRKYLTTVIINDGIYQSYFIKKQLCQINGNNKIYYAVIKAYESSREMKSYIVLSQNEFQLPTDIRKIENDFLRTYDWKKMIILPYNDKTIHYLNIDKWELVY